MSIDLNSLKPEGVSHAKYLPAEIPIGDGQPDYTYAVWQLCIIQEPGPTIQLMQLYIFESYWWTITWGWVKTLVPFVHPKS